MRARLTRAGRANVLQLAIVSVIEYVAKTTAAGGRSPSRLLGVHPEHRELPSWIRCSAQKMRSYPPPD